MFKRLCKIIKQLLFGSVFLSVLIVVLFRFVNPPISMFMILHFLESGNKIEKEWKSIEEISPSVPMAFIASEDQLFLTHSGFDVGAIQKAIESNQSNQRIRGGSTISQQLAKNLFLYSSKSYVRKGLEAYFTFLIELIWPKKRIMEVYLNVVEMGEGVYGVPKGAELYFKKSAESISTREAALMATALPNPKLYSLRSPSNYMIKRANWVQTQMRNLGGVGILNNWYKN